MYTLRLFGGITLEGPSGPVEGRVTQPRQLALLALVGAAPQATLMRDKVAALLWSESDQSRARHLLSDALYVIRRDLGRESLLVTGEQLRLNSEIVACDVTAFRAAMSEGAREEALAQYSGPFLDGFFLPEADEFERWVDAEARSFRRDAVETCRAAAEREGAAGNLAGAIRWTRRELSIAPLEEGTIRRLMALLSQAGDSAGAIEAYEAFAVDLRRALEVQPSEPTRELAARIRAAVSATQARAAPPSATHLARPVRHRLGLAAPRRPGPWIRRPAVPLALGVAMLTATAGWIIASMSSDRTGVAPVPEAYALYTRGRRMWDRRTPEETHRAIGYFHEALARDSTMALAYAALADAHAVLGTFQYEPEHEACAVALHYARRALELDSTLSEAHTAFGHIVAASKQDWIAAEAEFRRAIALDPGNPIAHHWLARVLNVTGRPAEALRERRIAAQLDPLSIPILSALAGTAMKNRVCRSY